MPTYTRAEIINILSDNPSVDVISATGWMVRNEADCYTDAEYSELCLLTEKAMFSEIERMAFEIQKMYNEVNNG